VRLLSVVVAHTLRCYSALVTLTVPLHSLLYTALAAQLTCANTTAAITPASIAVNITQECGKLLADVLLSRPQGTRPVTLLGYSLGARAIFYALQALAAAGERGQGIVENAVLLGAPLGTATKRWKKVRSVVAGRLVNGYSTRDFVLSLVYRSVVRYTR
jgi:Protein of unknown function (DUF726)